MCGYTDIFYQRNLFAYSVNVLNFKGIQFVVLIQYDFGKVNNLGGKNLGWQIWRLLINSPKFIGKLFVSP